MKSENRVIRFAVAVLIALFVNFMFANSVFMHSHKLADGSLVCHSHPYNPSSGHTHSSNIISLISSFNSASSAFAGVMAAVLTTGIIVLTLISLSAI